MTTTHAAGIGSGMDDAVITDEPSVRSAPFGHALVAAAEKRPEIYGLSADLARFTDMLPFAERFPQRFTNVGMAEQNLMGVAAGLAHEGLVPVASTYCVFATRRAYDFLAIQIALMKRNVKVAAGLPGLTTGYGGTHQGIDDIALTRSIPGLVVLDPADAVEIEQATAAMLDHDGPVYLRIQRGAVPVLSDQPGEPFRIGQARLIRDGADLGIIACGIMVGRALEAARQLAAEGISVAVLNAASLKPFDEMAVAELAGRTGRLVTAENHTINGGLFSATCEALARQRIGAIVEPVAIRDEFCGYGSLPYLAERHGLTTAHVVEACRSALVSTLGSALTNVRA